MPFDVTQAGSKKRQREEEAFPLVLSVFFQPLPHQLEALPDLGDAASADALSKEPMLDEADCLDMTWMTDIAGAG